ncbi:MAG TPA: DUF3293 domain-containing protein [Rhodopila sp.]|uniref:DUF3293 domain-containing protein n=1 Tax=Rhodopila sp. TaxID=2480087 RepID=UPI002C95107F|nr:DUF3293 domain-containing protein [Rhodopila sp.]HVY15583.1 DUF3293 domain-containing protein [Rhodopila sp.]
MLPVRLLRAYRSTAYHVPGAVVRIGCREPMVDRLLDRHRQRTGVLITAWNPFSRRMPSGWNARMQQALAQALHRRTTLPASGRWRRWSEDHLLALIAPEPAAVLARRFRQNAIVILRPRQPARLYSTYPRQSAPSHP